MNDSSSINWNEIVGLYGPLVWRTALGILNNQSDAADCFQETFTSALLLTARSQVRQWPCLLRRIATSRSLDILRKRMSERKHTEAPSDLSEVPGVGEDPMQHAQTRELAETLRRALARLPHPQGEIYCLRHLSDLSYEEIANELGISVESVGVTLHRVRARLRELLADVREVKHDRN